MYLSPSVRTSHVDPKYCAKPHVARSHISNHGAIAIKPRSLSSLELAAFRGERRSARDRSSIRHRRQRNATPFEVKHLSGRLGPLPFLLFRLTNRPVEAEAVHTLGHCKGLSQNEARGHFTNCWTKFESFSGKATDLTNQRASKLLKSSSRGYNNVWIIRMTTNYKVLVSIEVLIIWTSHCQFGLVLGQSRQLT